MPILPRIYFSTNDPIGDNRFGLDFPTALRDIAAMGGDPNRQELALMDHADQKEQGYDAERRGATSP